jgi:hypothetical protein
VHVVARGLLARLRPHTVVALAAVHAALRPRVAARNARPGTTLPGSRQPRLAALDRPALRPLPAQPSAYAEWQQARGNSDSHVAVAGPDYAGPSGLVKPPRDVRLRAPMVARFPQGTRVASHPRSPPQGRHSTVTAHRPTAHRP